MGAEGVDLAVFLAYFFHGDHQEYQVVGAGNLGAFPLLHYFRNCDIKNTDLIQCFWSLRTILTKLILVHKYTQLMTYFWIDGLK